MIDLFSVNNLDVFKRPGCIIEKRSDDYSAGCWVDLENGWRVSIQWGYGNYGDNYSRERRDGPPRDSTEAEIAVMTPAPKREMVTWGLDEWGETVQGYCSMERVQRIIDLVSEGKLMQEYTPPPPPMELRAVDEVAARVS